MQGSMNAVLPDDIVDVETTMRAGQVGACARLFRLAKRSGAAPQTKADWRLHFFSWLGHPDYRLSGHKPNDGGVIRYFEDLAKIGVVATHEQQAWYEVKQREQGDKMLQEYPSIIDECDKAMVSGAIYPELARMRMEGRVRQFPVERGYPLCVYFDLGTEDGLAAWAIQKMPMDILVHAWSSGDGVGAVGAVDIVRRWAQELGPVAAVFVPHDADIRDKGSGKSFRTQMIEPGMLPASMVYVVPRTPDVWVGVGEVRRRMTRMWFASRCDVNVRQGETELPSGIGRLEGYRKNDRGLVHKDLCCHTADALRTFGEADSLGMVDSIAGAGSLTTPFNQDKSGRFARDVQVKAVRATMGMRL